MAKLEREKLEAKLERAVEEKLEGAKLKRAELERAKGAAMRVAVARARCRTQP